MTTINIPRAELVTMDVGTHTHTHTLALQLFADSQLDVNYIKAHMPEQQHRRRNDKHRVSVKDSERCSETDEHRV